jgi:hypothetical protein
MSNKGGEKMKVLSNVLKSKIVLNDLTIPKMAEVMMIDKSSLHRKINNQTKFNLEEMRQIQEILNLNKEDVIQIFFSEWCVFSVH